mmetsp:Transcript_44820/g.51528  ORF Transcript_44820/g.51528 Transcript_44820/m.51528 type:complete len:104 (+) Transcript_44820:349-660(+)|eukprot:CAMPEP_0115005962 /NCGR_PEP_ID=MMETSP0216-20121206/20201_1 /TAXON_ID=223996 /ORGANISM="Protocruzia adherens, Strain Boccale" /LENGTH=103 /DNA_ID=CAMNT_0002372423 /DNA_START=172 /DNA_END=483 /DNA_ORIENTATION=+
MSEEEKAERKITEKVNEKSNSESSLKQGRRQLLAERLKEERHRMIMMREQLKQQVQIENTKKKIESLEATEGGNEEEISMLNLELQQAQDRLDEAKEGRVDVP